MQVLCGQCGQSIVVEDFQAGTQVACPRCQNQVAVPRLDEMTVEQTADDSSFGDLSAEEGFAGQVKQAMSRKIQVACGSCGKTLTVSARMAGKKARCPACSTQILIPYPDEAEADAQIERLTNHGHHSHREAPPKPSGVHADNLVPTMVPTQPVQPEPPADVPPADVPPAAHIALAAHAESAPDAADTRAAAAAALESCAKAEGDAERVPGGLAEAVADVAADRRRRLVRKARGWAFYAALFGFAAVAIGIGIYVGLMLIARATDKNQQANSGTDNKTQPDGTGKTNPVAPTTTQKTTPTQPVKPAPVAVAKMSVVSTVLKDFAAAGYYPARQGFAYWEVTAAVKAGASPLTFRNHGSEVSLKTASGSYASLGAPAEAVGLPPRSARRSISVPAGQGQQVAFLFEVPAADTEGTLKVAALDEATIRPVPPKAAPGVAGTYQEAVPRNLRPMLRDPVMAAIQSAPGHQIIVREGEKALAVSIPAAAVAGTARPSDSGLYQAVLRNGAAELKCSLRMTHDGEGLILYLADQPFHQITYAREGRSSPRPPEDGEKPPRRRPKPDPATRESTEPKDTKDTKKGVGSLFDDPDTLFPPSQTRPATEKVEMPVLPPKRTTTAPTMPKDHGRRTIFD